MAVCLKCNIYEPTRFYGYKQFIFLAMVEGVCKQ